MHSGHFQEIRVKFEHILKGRRCLAIGYHSDADGMCSTALLVHFLLKRGHVREELVLYPVNTPQRLFSPEQEAEIIVGKSDLVFYLDLANQHADQMQRFRKQGLCVVSIDHHHFPDGWPEVFDLYIHPPHAAATVEIMKEFVEAKNGEWLVAVGQAGDGVLPVHPDPTVTEVAHVLNVLGLIQRDDEPRSVRDHRCQTLLELLLTSSHPEMFLKQVKQQKDIWKLYQTVSRDITQNIERLRTLAPTLSLGSHRVFKYSLEVLSGYEIIGQVLKGHLPFAENNATSIMVQELTAKSFQVFLSSTNPRVDCGKIAVAHGGGGHINRAGFRSDGGNLDQIVEGMIQVITTSLIE